MQTEQDEAFAARQDEPKQAKAYLARTMLLDAIMAQGEVDFDDMVALSKANTILRKWENA